MGLDDFLTPYKEIFLQEKIREVKAGFCRMRLVLEGKRPFSYKKLLIILKNQAFIEKLFTQHKKFPESLKRHNNFLWFLQKFYDTKSVKFNE